MIRMKKYLRVIACLVLIFTIHTFLGIDQIVYVYAQGGEGDPEQAPYELTAIQDVNNFNFDGRYRALDLYEWVRTNISYEPYSGTRKGANATYLSGSGNALDQALLLGSLFNLADVPWRLATGDVRLPMRDALGWLCVSSADQAAQLLTKAGVSYKIYPGSSNPQYLILRDHVWIESKVDYFPMRGSAADDATTGVFANEGDPAESWIALDPAVTVYNKYRMGNLINALGEDSQGMFDLIQLESGDILGDEGISINNLPGDLIENTAQKAGEGLKGFLKARNTTIGNILRVPGETRMEPRQGLPGNLPYDVIGSVKTIDPDSDDSLTNFLTEQREYASLELYFGSQRLLQTGNIGVSRIAQEGAAIYFEEDPEDEIIEDLYSQGNACPVARDLGKVRPVIRIGDVKLTLNENDFGSDYYPFNLGTELKLKVLLNGANIGEIPIITGGQYEFCGIRTLSEPDANRRYENLIEYSEKIGSETGYLTTVNPEDVIQEFLQLSAQSVLLQQERFEKLGLAAVGFTPVSAQAQPVLAGIVPTVEGDNISSPALVVFHLADKTREALIPRIFEPFASQKSAKRLDALIKDVALTTAFEPLTGNDSAQSASRLMKINNEWEKSQDQSGMVSTLLRSPNASDLNGRVPASLSGLQDKVALDLRNTDLVLIDDEIFGLDVAGQDNGKTGWAYWRYESATPSGKMISPDGFSVSAYAPLNALYPLDMLIGASKPRFQTLLTRAIPWADGATGVTAAMEPGMTACACLTAPWLEPEDTLPELEALPASAIAFFGAADFFSRPIVEELFVSPQILNSITVGENPAKTQVNVNVTMSNKVDILKLFFEDEAGNQDFSFDPVLDNDSRIYDLEIDLPITPNEITEGTHVVVARGEYDTGVKSDRKTASYIVDNTAPALEIATTTATLSGRYTIKAKVWDQNIQEYELKWKKASDNDWRGVLASGNQNLPLLMPITTIDSQALGMSGSIVFGLFASDMAGNASSTNASLNFLNDITPPQISLSSEPLNMIDNGAQWHDYITMIFTVHENVADMNSYLKSVKFYLQSQDDPNKAPEIYVDEVYTSPSRYSYHPCGFPYIMLGVFDRFQINTYDIKRSSATEKWTLFVEATDFAGNTSRIERRDIQIKNLLWNFYVDPASFIVGEGRYSNIKASFTEPLNWKVEIWGGQPRRKIKEFSDYGITVSRLWYGDDPESETGFATPGLYDVYLTFSQFGYERTLRRAISLASATNPHCPWIKEIRSVASPGAAEFKSRITIDDPNAVGQMGSEFMATSSFPFIEITAELGESIAPYLDGGWNQKPDLTYPYDDCYWALEFKSSMAFPTYDDVFGSTKDPGKIAFDREHWRMIAWGHDYPKDGIVKGCLNTTPLSFGYYDVRLWMTDGTWTVQRLVFFLKVTPDGPPQPVPGSIGALTLSAVDMSIPFNGVNVEVKRSYNSHDVYKPGPLGYGWKLHGVSLEIEGFPQGDGEYDEAMITLPDGRKYFFCNNPASNVTFQNNSWNNKGRYNTRPFGMELYRPGGSWQYHWPYAETTPVIGPETVVRYLDPGAPTKPIKLQYTGANGHIYNSGKVAYLQTEDKTWYIFEWKTGDLLEIIPPDGHITKFKKETEADILIYDTSNRQIRVERDGDTRRINKALDPSGKFVQYEYDKEGNLSIVTDRSGRKRFYIYDTPEIKDHPMFKDREDLTGMNKHFLVDVRVDDDLSDGYVKPMFDGDRTPSNIDPDADPDIYLSYQDYPGDISIMKTKYENGMIKGFETYAGNVSMEHEPDPNAPGGTELITDDTTGEKAYVKYDGEHRVTEKTDLAGVKTTYQYDDSEGANIQGALISETDALGNTTSYEYPKYDDNHYSSFADMFEAYVGYKIGDDSAQKGYLTSEQGQPSKLKQKLGSQDVVTELSYEMNTDKLSAFQPTSVKDPNGFTTHMSYDGKFGKMETIEPKNSKGGTIARTKNFYYESGNTDEIYGTPLSADSPSIGRLSKTIHYPDPANETVQKITYYGYKFVYSGNVLTHEEHAVKDGATGKISYSKVDPSGL
ncbi:hypothetical protein JW926_02360, partial [Candidatus Sumerlaeota bacterium]|nr:hypothetical protein [Candidatus Sumerlaeota bacterium]